MKFKVKYKSFIIRSLPSLLYAIIITLVLNIFVEINTFYKLILSILFLSFVFLGIIFRQRVYIISVVFYVNKVKFNYSNFYKKKHIVIDINKLGVEFGGVMLGGGVTKKTLIIKKNRKKVLKQYPIGDWSEDKITELSNKIKVMKQKSK